VTDGAPGLASAATVDAKVPTGAVSGPIAVTTSGRYGYQYDPLLRQLGEQLALLAGTVGW
jgi:inosine/xanthosine triphosphate pyrophosphatase family protein